MQTISEWWMWLIFLAVIAVMLWIDIVWAGGKKVARINIKKALAWSIIWFTVALLFNLLFWYYLNNTAGTTIANVKALEFLTGYLVEKTLSIDNIFVFLLIFNYFSISIEYQRRVLLYGILGAVVMRFVMILLGSWLISQFSWIFYIFGAFLLFTGLKMLKEAEHQPDLAKSPILNIVKKRLRITDKLYNEKFFIYQNGLLYATPLFLALVLIEVSDLIFAIDSIPAVFAITSDPFIVFTSNIFAILGLRALYFLLADIIERFHLLKYGLAIILVFIGFKMLLHGWVKIPISISLSVVAFIIIISISMSLWVTRQKYKK